MTNWSTGTANTFDIGAGTVLVIGYGNPGRMDDGLGPALSTRLEAFALKGVTVETDYQLAVEHAHEIAKHDNVIFVDASVGGPAPFSFDEIPVPDHRPSFNSHHLSPEAALYFAKTMFGSAARGFMLGIRGYQYDRFEESLSDGAKRNLDEAFDYLVKMLGGSRRIS